MLHPAMPDCPGHAFWLRDFQGSASVFSVVFGEGWSRERVNRFVNALRLFRIGYSWGGVTSLAMTYPRLPGRSDADRLVRLNVGLEAVADLIEDLKSALEEASKSGGRAHEIGLPRSPL